MALGKTAIGMGLLKDYEGGKKDANSSTPGLGTTDPASGLMPFAKQPAPKTTGNWAADFTLPPIRFGNYLTNIDKLSGELKQQEATTGQQTAPQLRSAIMEEGLKIGAEAASQDVMTRKEDIIAGKQLQIGERAIQLSEEQLEEQKDQADQGGGTVICTELHRQGYLSDRVLMLDSLYREENISLNAYLGYMIWACFIVSQMRKSKIVTKLVSLVGVGFALECAHRMDRSIKGSLIGKIALKVGIPICEVIGNFVAMRRWSGGTL